MLNKLESYSLELSHLETPGWRFLCRFVFRICIGCGFEEEDSLGSVRSLSCFVLLKSVLFNPLCVFDLYSYTLHFPVRASHVLPELSDVDKGSCYGSFTLGQTLGTNRVDIVITGGNPSK